MSTLEELGRACPSRVRRGHALDSIDGVTPGLVASPLGTGEVAAVMRVASSAGLSVVARGAGTKLDWGNPPASADLMVDVSRMDNVIEHEAGDLVARVEAGTTLAHLSEVLGSKGQRFPVDEVVAGSTVGGVVSTGLSGPLRYMYGAVRDLVLGITVVRADGVVAHAGSKVVKNVAGYDLAKLFTGSYGTLGIVTELALKLKPVPMARRFVVAACARPADLKRFLSALLSCQAAPTALELERSGPSSPVQLSVLVEGRPRSVELRAAEIATLLGGGEPSMTPPAGWGQLPGPVTLKLTAMLSAVPSLVEQASSIALQFGLPARLTGSAGAGVLFMGLPDRVPAVVLAALLADLRAVCDGVGGHAVVLRAGAALKSQLDPWGPVPGIDLMRRVKERFDPDRRLAPGRFVGGI
ncbi:MAG TPA: FAD-binding oxidoreductase [Acidimicrobiales bacterium]|nr:FAD-binding oxidoreductase [Acidimicrobiales bacterium]